MTKITGNTYAAMTWLKKAGATYVPAADGNKAHWIADDEAMSEIKRYTDVVYSVKACKALSALTYTAQ